MSIDLTDRKLLNILQLGLPLEEEPFKTLGDKLGISETEIIHRVHGLKQAGIIRYIGGIFDSSRLGYHSTLVGMHISENRLDEVAQRISDHPGVSHNYARNHYWNLWFTLTLAGDKSLAEEISFLGTGAEAWISLPALEVFKIGAYFDLLQPHQPSPRREETIFSSPSPLSPFEKKLIVELEQDLPLKTRPFDDLARHQGMEVAELLDWAKSLLHRGIMRRYGASLNHRRVGFTANAMSCWIVPSSAISRVAEEIASYGMVSHCYQRQTCAGWPYNVFAMIHGHNSAECEMLAEHISAQTEIADYILLYSTKEYKKGQVRHFIELV